MTSNATGDLTGDVTVIWWGHATTTIELAGRRILTDPVLTRRMAHLSRISGPTPGRAASDVDVVLISHLHLDHLHAPSLRMLGPGVRVVAPTGTVRVLRRSAPKIARRVEEVGPGEVLDLDGVRLRAVQALHDGRRWPVSRVPATALGYLLEPGGTSDAQRIWFAGDTGLFDAMTEFDPVDIAIVPIGGWGPSLGPTHLGPAQAAEAVRRVGARHAVPIHYGTFWPTGLRHVHPAAFRRWFTDPSATFADELGRLCPQAQAHVIIPGQSVSVPARARD